MIEQIKKAVEATRNHVAVMFCWEESKHWYPGYLLLSWRNREGRLRPGFTWATFQSHPDIPGGHRHIYTSL